MSDHYEQQREAELALIEKHEIKDIDMSHYTDEMYFDEIKEYLIKVFGMTENMVAYEIEKHFPKLFETQKAKLNLLI